MQTDIDTHTHHEGRLIHTPRSGMNDEDDESHTPPHEDTSGSAPLAPSLSPASARLAPRRPPAAYPAQDHKLHAPRATHGQRTPSAELTPRQPQAAEVETEEHARKTKGAGTSKIVDKY